MASPPTSPTWTPNAPKRRSSTITSVKQATANLVLNQDPPTGFVAATAQAAAKAPTIGEVRRGSFDAGVFQQQQVEKRRRTWSQGSNIPGRRSRDVAPAKDEHERGLEAFPALTEEPSRLGNQLDATQVGEKPAHAVTTTAASNSKLVTKNIEIEEAEADITPSLTSADPPKQSKISKDRRVYSSGYIPPPKVPWTTSTLIFLRAFWSWFLTPSGFLITIYGLNVVAWGGMLFLLLCNASASMCWAPIPNEFTAGERSPAASLALNAHYPRYYNCNDINSPRRVWLEIDSQILNALFCVTGFGLIPWRFRDWYFLLLWRCANEKKVGKWQKMYGLRKLAGIYRGWFRLPGSQTLDTLSTEQYHSTTYPGHDLSSGLSAEDDLRLPLPLEKSPSRPLTGVRAPPTKLWKLDFFVWSQVLNTFLQVVLCGFMWGMTRYNRPSWVTGLLIGLACVEVGAGGFVSYLEGKKVGRVEGVARSAPVSDDEEKRMAEV